MSELINADNEYKEWISKISTDFRKSQIRASMKINDEMLRFYWRLGKGISSMSEQFGYGTGFYKTVSEDLKSILPDVKSFSPTNLKYMRYFYEMYPDAVICPQVEDKLNTEINRPQVGDDLQIIFRIPWGHNKIILDKCKGNSAKALFYIRKTIENNWSRDVLLNFLGTDLYERQGKAITNLKYMRDFYEMYSDAVICPQVEDELITDANRPQVGDDLQIIFRILWDITK